MKGCKRGKEKQTRLNEKKTKPQTTFLKRNTMPVLLHRWGLGKGPVGLRDDSREIKSLKEKFGVKLDSR